MVGDGEVQGYVEKYSQQRMSLHSTPESLKSLSTEENNEAENNKTANDKIDPDDYGARDLLPENPEEQEDPKKPQEQAQEFGADNEVEDTADDDSSDVDKNKNTVSADSGTENNQTPQVQDSNQDEESIPKEKLEKNKNEKEEKHKKLEERKKLEQKKKEQEEKREQRIKKKNKIRKELINIISESEKAKKKNENRKKIQNIAAQMSGSNKSKERSQSDHAFEKTISDSLKNFNGTSAGRGDGVGNIGQSGNGFGMAGGLSENEYNMISAQIKPHWVVPSGIRGADSLIIEIRIKLGDNGEVIPSELMVVNEERYATDPVFRAAADGARRAILEASPLSLPPNKTELFREFIFAFDVGKASGR
ncbi:MAG: TonB C-terminal domain-containing protein [Holosporaceae bacterium]|nr:TonB C-terminal domain-containing protein [Holosporaceae bacterium]